MDDTKQQAIVLRQQGHTYPEISQALSVSVDWCKRNLKGVKVTKKVDPILSEIMELALRPEGCTNYELTGVVYKHNQELIGKGDYMSSYKRKARSKNKNCLFRPAWISPTKAVESQQALYSLANDLYERIQEAVADYTSLFPEVEDKKSVLDELVKISNGYLLPEGLSTRLARHEIVVEQLCGRHTNPAP